MNEPTPAKMLDDLTALWGHARLQAEISARYRVNCALRRMEIVAMLWTENCQPTTEDK